MIESIVWAGVVLYFLVRAELSYREWLKLQAPIHKQQYQELSKKISDLQNQVNSLALSREYD